MSERDKTPREMILAQAADITAHARNEAYGDPIPNHENIAAFMNAYVQARRTSMKSMEQFVLDAEDAMAFAMLLKVARIAQRLGDQYDSYVDLCAYAAMMGEAQQGRLREEKYRESYAKNAVPDPAERRHTRPHGGAYGTVEDEMKMSQDMGVNR